MKIIFWSGTKSLGLAQYLNQFLVWHKKFGPAQNVFGPAKEQGTRLRDKYCFLCDLKVSIEKMDLVCILC